ncbi:HNH nuclease [Neobacillus rhizosphaerae]|uniref:HNH nuclease n=1 Tax=Neobacillus rhizosphaerae TaxID=2880965 RepID=UPI003D2958F5
MIKININDNIKKIIETAHYKDTNKQVRAEIEKVKGEKEYKKLMNYLYDQSGNLIENKLQTLLIGNKEEIIKIIDAVGKIPKKKDDPFERLYLNFTGRIWSKALLDKLNVRVCPYCNRLYTFTLENEGIRPQFDHYFPKSLFSYLSVSLYNLIPSCSICNSKKKNLNTYDKINDLYYPYDDEFSHDVVFQTSPINNDFLYWTGVSNNFDIKLISRDEKQNCKVKNIKEHLKIELLYKEHNDYIREIIRKVVIYNDSRIDELLEQFPDLFGSKDEVINSIFMSYINKESWGNRPLSKVTHDIYEEFNIFPNKLDLNKV